MDLTARDIHEKQFHDAWRGYNQEEVDDFLDRVAEVFDLTQRENGAMRGRVGELEQALTTSRETEEMLKKTLVSAQQAAEEAIAKAKEKARAMVTEAEARAGRVNEETTQRLASVEAQIRRKALDADREHTVRKRELDASVEKLRAFESELKRRLHAFLEQQLRSLGSLEDDGGAARSGRPAGPGDVAEPGSDVNGGAHDREATGSPANEGQGEGDRVIRLPDDAEVGAHPRRGVRGLFSRDE